MPDIYRIKWNPEAWADVESIHAYVKQDSPQNARELVARIILMIDSLDQLPARFKQVGHSRRRGSPIRAVVVDSIVIYYRVDEDTQVVTVMTLRNGRRRQPR